MSSSVPPDSQSPRRLVYIRKLQAERTPNDLSLSDNRFMTVALDDRDQLQPSSFVRALVAHSLKCSEGGARYLRAPPSGFQCPGGGVAS